MKNQIVLKAFAFSIAMALMMSLSTTANAQSDGFFCGGNENYNNRDEINDGGGISNSGIGETAPLGSGLLIMAAAGGGYAIARRRNYRSNKTFRRGAVMIVAFSMILSLTNCKKKTETINAVSEGVQITLNLDNGSKVVVDPTGHTNPDYATVTFEKDDIIYVGNNGAYCGFLKHDGTNFKGTVNPTSTDDYLHFYFMGNKGAESEPSIVNISDQTSKYPVISYAHSNSLYSSSVNTYSARLQNYCAIARFPLSGSGTTSDVYVRGMKNTVTIDFAANNYAQSTTGTPFSFAKAGNGTIKLHAESPTDKWAILLEQDAVTDADLLADGFDATTVSVPAIKTNTYHADDIKTTTLTNTGNEICYAYSVNANGSVVRFSPGNLQYNDYETVKWRFAERQWDVCQGYGEWITTSWVDFFGWGTWSGTEEQWNPLNTSENDDEYVWNGDDATFHYELAGHNDWYTLSESEYLWLIGSYNSEPGTDCREGYRFLNAKITVDNNNYRGLIIFPDAYIGGVGSYTYNDNEGTRVNVSADDWALMETAGAVFLPAAGRRLLSSVSSCGHSGEKDYDGYYWASTTAGYAHARYLYFCYDAFPGHSVNPIGTTLCFYGQSVRLVR